MPDSNRHTSDSSGVGQWLLSCREAKGASLEEAADITRISKSYIDALEREEFDRLPAPAYCKGFLRIYAGYLGVSPDEAVARYELLVRGAAGSAGRLDYEPPPREPDVPRKAAGRWLVPLVLFALVILMSFLIDTDPGPLRRPHTPELVAVPSTVPSPVQPVLSSAHKAQSPTPAPVAAQPEQPDPASSALPAGAPEQEGVILQLKINQDSWLNVDIDGRLSKQYDLKSGDIIEWKADSVITLDIGNAGGVEGELNGTPLPSFGPVGKKIHAVIRSDGVVAQ